MKQKKEEPTRPDVQQAHSSREERKVLCLSKRHDKDNICHERRTVMRADLDDLCCQELVSFCELLSAFSSELRFRCTWIAEGCILKPNILGT